MYYFRGNTDRKSNQNYNIKYNFSCIKNENMNKLIFMLLQNKNYNFKFTILDQVL